jgi:hypothetical protein
MPEKVKRSRRSALLEIVSAVGLALFVTAGILYVQRNAPPSSGTPEPAQRMTLDPQVAANLGAMSFATPLADVDAQRWNDFRSIVNACDEYSSQRHDQMNQHIDWLIDPSDIQPEVIIGLGNNPQAQLIYGMAAYTSTEWRQHGRPTESCLREIGLQLNTMLVAAGREPFTIYESSS